MARSFRRGFTDSSAERESRAGRLRSGWLAELVAAQARALRYAMREEDFAPVFGAGVFLVAVGTIVYSLGNDWDVADGFYFSVATLTTTSVANPDLEIHDRRSKP